MLEPVITRRVFLANQLIDDGIASIIIMNPFYGTRLPNGQRGSGLNYLSDLFVMGGALILECHTILRWCQNQGYGPFALHGISMGGYMATICATTVPFPVSLIPCLSWTSASVVFVEGVLSHSVDWQTLTKQFIEDSIYAKVIRPRIQPSVQPAFVTQKTKAIRSPATDLLVPPPPPPSPPSGQKPPDHLIDILTFYRRPLVDVSKVLNYVKSHNRLHLYMDNHVWESAVSAVRAVSFPSVFSEKVKVDPEVREFLRELLDFFTHLGNFPPVADARLITSVTAGRDAYVPRDGVVPFNVVFPAAEIRYLPQSGHVSTYVRNYLWNQDFRRAVCDTMNRHMMLHYGFEAPIFGKVSKSLPV
ncbi:Protein ABHD18 [Taenia crassiceps]|uniref:Protein ABHD18 n=1 Tax=Taenia crassiceps TaxID=6207 RepID=A0ABR4Q564_9CEST